MITASRAGLQADPVARVRGSSETERTLLRNEVEYA